MNEQMIKQMNTPNEEIDEGIKTVSAYFYLGWLQDDFRRNRVDRAWRLLVF